MYLFVLMSVFQLHAQEKTTRLEGSVSYITGHNIYVKFVNTRGIENGDTLFILKNEVLIPALIVQHRSSISCLCQTVGSDEFKVEDRVFAQVKSGGGAAAIVVQPEEKVEQDVSQQVVASESKAAKPKKG